MLVVFGELEANIKRQSIRKGIAARQEPDKYRHGPAPLGFEKDGRRIVESGEYNRVCEILEQVAHGEMSKRRAAKETGTSRRAITRSLTERNELYGL